MRSENQRQGALFTIYNRLMVLDGGTVTGAGTLTITGGLRWTGGAMTGSGETTLGSVLGRGALPVVRQMVNLASVISRIPVLLVRSNFL